MSTSNYLKLGKFLKYSTILSSTCFLIGNDCKKYLMKYEKTNRYTIKFCYFNNKVKIRQPFDYLHVS